MGVEGFTRREYVVCTILCRLMDEDGMGLCVFRPFEEVFRADTKYAPIASKHSAA